MNKYQIIIFLFLSISFRINSQCNNAFTLGLDKQLCKGETTIIGAGAGFDSYLWNDNTTNQIITVTQSGDYYCTVTEIDESTNLIANSDFQLGNTSFNSNYTYLPIDDVTGPNAVYGVINNPNTWFNPFSACPDHTTGFGNMMVLDGATSNGSNTAFWCQTVAVNANTAYDFSYWAQNLTNAPFANIRVEIGGVIMGSNLTPSTVCLWEQTSYTWNSGTNTSIQICLYNLEMSGNGNDFAIDDITMNPICSYTDTINIEIAMADTITSFKSICSTGDSILIAGIWVKTAGTYYETIQVNNCTQIEKIIVSVLPNPLANAGADQSIIVGTDVLLNGEDVTGATYTWSLNGVEISADQSFLVKPLENSTYLLTVQSSNGCVATDDISITVIEDNSDILFPNAFSPNNDNVNDVFRIVSSDNYEFIRLQVFNRWGELVHSGLDGNHGWNGQFKGQDQEIASYIFIAEVKQYNKEAIIRYGTLALIR